MRGLATSSVAMFLSLFTGACLSKEVAGYTIFRHDEDRKCSASLFFDTTQGREANITYFVFDDGRMDEIYFGLRPTGAFDPAVLASEPIDVMIDEVTVLSGHGGPSFTGFLSLPGLEDGQQRRFLDALAAGQELAIVLKETEQQLVIDLNGLRTARVELSKCVEDINANS